MHRVERLFALRNVYLNTEIIVLVQVKSFMYGNGNMVWGTSKKKLSIFSFAYLFHLWNTMPWTCVDQDPLERLR